MPDFADLAAAREQELRDDAIADHHRRLARASRPTADWPALTDGDTPAAGTDEDPPCAVCGEPIPAARRLALAHQGCDTCIECARELESGLHRAAHPNRK
jgi:hypothetical protein